MSEKRKVKGVGWDVSAIGNGMFIDILRIYPARNCAWSSSYIFCSHVYSGVGWGKAIRHS